MSKEVITEELKKLKTTKEREKNESRISSKKVDKNPAFLCIYSNLHGAGRMKQK